MSSRRGTKVVTGSSARGRKKATPKSNTPQSIEDLITDGFVYKTGASQVTTLALSSLRIALEAWFSTYQAVGFRFHLFTDKGAPSSEDTDFNHGRRYFEAQSEALVHMQHFAELVLKDLLRGEHELLATKANKNPVILHRLLNNEIISDEELANEFSLEFSDALETVTKLITANRFARSDLAFIATHTAALRGLNTLRNRIWHRGLFSVRYPALDELFGRHLIPFVTGVTKLPEYARAKPSWKPRALACGIDVLGELEAAFSGSSWNIRRVAYLKELGRAAFDNPLTGEVFFKREDEIAREKAEAAAESRAAPHEIEPCPVCGVMSLVLIDSTEVDEDSGKASTFVWQIECECCSFLARSELGNPSAAGLTALRDYFG